MFKYSVTAYVEDKKGYYLNPEQVTSITVYAKNAKEAEDKALTAVPEKHSYGSNYKWVIKINKIEEVVSN